MCSQDAALLALAGRLAAEAASVILAIRAAGFQTLTKLDDSPVTEADHRAEALILAGLREAASIPVVAEEEVAGGLCARAGAEFWLVDPLDGTREFVAGTDDFTVNIGLVRDGVAVLGAVALPAYGELYLGRLGHGASRRDGSGETRIQVRPPPADGLAVLASRHYASDPTLLAFLGRQRIASLRNIGSAAKFVRVAEGRADLYPRLGRTMEWDTAGAAGGGRGRRRQREPVRWPAAALWQAGLGEPAFRLPRRTRRPGSPADIDRMTLAGADSRRKC